MPRVAISHDWIFSSRGAERVLGEFCRGLEPTRIYTLFADPERIPEWLADHSVYTSRLGRLPGVQRYYRYLLPYFPRALQSLSVGCADLLLSVSHSVAKSVPREPSIPHVCYCLTPMRYLWEPEVYGPLLRRSIRGRLLKIISGRLKAWDLATAGNVDHFVAISKTVQQRIARIYGRRSDLIYPGVDLDRYRPGPERRDDYYLVVSALVPQKRIDLAVAAFAQSGRKLVVVGEGPVAAALRRRGGDSIHFLGRAGDPEIRGLYRRARALIFPGIEDFGLVPVEAQACGCPVIAFGEGGATETVVEGESGFFFREACGESLNEAIRRFEKASLDPRKIVASASRFSMKRFRSQWRSFLNGLGVRDPFPRWE